MVRKMINMEILPSVSVTIKPKRKKKIQNNLIFFLVLNKEIIDWE